MNHLFFFPFPILSDENVNVISSIGIPVIACIPWYGEIVGLNPEKFPENMQPPAEMKPGADFPILFNSYRTLIKDLSPGEASLMGKAGSAFFDDDSIWNMRSSIRERDKVQQTKIDKNIYQCHITLLLAAENERLEQEVNKSFDDLFIKEPLAEALDPLTPMPAGDKKNPAAPIPAGRVKKIAEAWYRLFGLHLEGKQYGFILPDPVWLDSLSALFDGEPERIEPPVHNQMEMFRLPQNTEVGEVHWLRGAVAGFVKK